MAVIKRPYEISIWTETLGENGQKIEHKDFIIGAHDMSYLGRATSIKFETKLNGTHTLTFSMPDKWFDSRLGDYVYNEFVDQLYNERKVKFKYKGKWYEFYIKSVADAKNYKSYMKTYTCNDAFIDELSRNGYGLTFDEELYNNVEEIGTFTEEILNDSIWYYSPKNNWGDFTENTEEKLFKIPVSQFKNGEIKGYKLNFGVDNSDSDIINIFTKEKRKIELGDDLARQEELFWDSVDKNGVKHNPLIGDVIERIENDGYIYVPYSQLDFCYKTTINNESKVALTSTEEPCFYNNETGSYSLAPATIDPTALIQFIAIPQDAVVEIDEAGTIVNKDYSYVMTVEQWNLALAHNKNFYQFEPLEQIRISDEGILFRKKVKKYEIIDISEEDFYKKCSTGNFCAYYDGYIQFIGDLEVLKGKKISISDRTEINITEEIDSYVKAYNQRLNNIIKNEFTYNNLLEEGELQKWEGDKTDYKICSKSSTRQVVPQLARNLVQNGVNIRSTDGWEVVKLSDTPNLQSTKIQLAKDSNQKGILQLTKSGYEDDGDNDNYNIDVYAGENDHTEIKFPEKWGIHDYNTIINFGIVGQGIQLKKDKIYVLGIRGKFSNNDAILIGEGNVISSGDYKIYWEHSDNGYTGNFYSFYSIFKDINGDNGEEDIREGFIFIKMIRDYTNPYLGIWLKQNNYGTREIHECWFFEAFTKGIDQFSEEDNPQYKYSGREIFENNQVLITPQNYVNTNVKQDGGFLQLYWDNTSVFQIDYKNNYSKEEIKRLVLFEDDVMPGDTYEYQQYFIQQVCAGDTQVDTFRKKKFLSENENEAPFSSKDYVEEDLRINTRYFNLNKCPFYTENAGIYDCDCSYGGTDNPQRICLYQKYGYCPYLFQTEKHPRKIRTLKKSKSNRFNLTQDLSKVFEIYPIYYTNNDTEGHIIKTDSTDSEDNPIKIMDKRIFYITEKGQENKLGFRYGKNLSNISRTLKSDKIVTKLYVQDVDSNVSRTGLCSIKTAEDNVSKDNTIIDFSYYVAKGLINEKQLERDLYGIEEGDMAYLKTLGYYNTEYDRLSNLIINLQSDSYTELEANVSANIDGIVASKQQIHKIIKQLNKYSEKYEDIMNNNSSSIRNTFTKLEEQIAIINNLYEETFNPEGTLQNSNSKLLEGITIYEDKDNPDNPKYIIWGLKDSIELDNEKNENISIETFKDSEYYNSHSYNRGMLGQFNREYNQIKQWKKQRAAYLEKINKLSLRFYRKYEPFLKEGTWTDSNYITDNAYYHGALEVSADGAIPKVSYTITTTDISALPQYQDDYNFEIADTTYVEDIGMFGINQKTGMPNRLKVLISGITESPDSPTSNSITVQNFTTQFEDLFKQVSASVQSLTYNENIYKRSSNFTANQNVKEESLQGTLDNNNLTLINTQENNIELDSQGQAGSDINNHANKYKLNGQGLFFSNNGGQSWNIGVGPSGINADYIKVGNLDVGKVKLVDNDFLYFYWDKNGLIALKEPQSSNENTNLDSYTCFNRYGLSIVENGQIKLRTGYKFNGRNGQMVSENIQSDRLGFYLYDKNGKPIFETSPNISEEDMTARISLRGEMFITDGLISSDDEIVYYKLKRRITPAPNKAIVMESISEPDLNLLEEENAIDLLDSSPRIFESQSFPDDAQIRRDNNWKKQLLKKGLINRGDYYNYYKKGNTLYLKYTRNNSNGEWFKDKTSEATQSYYLIVKDKYNETYPLREKEIKTQSEFDNWARENSLSTEYIFYPDHGFQEGNVVYKIQTEERYYSSWEPAGNNITDDTIGLYLNNKKNNTTENISDNNRILSCVKQEGANTKNIFSILRGGSLYIGGTVKATKNDIINLSDEISIENPGIELSKNSNGQYEIKMDFSNFKDSNGNDLLSTISGSNESIRNDINDRIDGINAIHSDLYNLLAEIARIVYSDPSLNYSWDDISHI